MVGKEQGGVRGGWNYLLDLRYYSYYILLTSLPPPHPLPPRKEGETMRHGVSLKNFPCFSVFVKRLLCRKKFPCFPCIPDITTFVSIVRFVQNKPASVSLRAFPCSLKRVIRVERFLRCFPSVPYITTFVSFVRFVQKNSSVLFCVVRIYPNAINVA